MSEYNPSAVGVKGSIFGYPYTTEESDLILMPIPWDVTVSYGAGTSNAPDLILEESTQLDFSLPYLKDAHKYPVAMLEVPELLAQASRMNRAKAEQVIQMLEQNGELFTEEAKLQSEVNAQCQEMIAAVYDTAQEWLGKGKLVGSVGGDHSTPLGLLKALGRHHQDFGVLQIDAHMDLRRGYEGFTYSHASIMYNALNEVPSISKLVQIGIRDFCEEEEEVVREMQGKVDVHFDEVIRRELWQGKSWPQLIGGWISALPQNVYISFDMDGLDPALCPTTGTPVPGGLDFHQAVAVIEEVVRSGRQIIGFDVSEAGNHPWDASVAARILFRICVACGVSRGRLSFS